MDTLTRLLTQIRARRHTAKATLAEESYRDILQRCAGVASSTEIRSMVKARAVLAEFDRLQIALPAGGRRRQLTAIQRKMWSLWQTLADQTLVNDCSMHGLCAWIEAQYGVSDMQFLTWPQESNCIERLKRWLARGDDQPVVREFGSRG